MVRAVAGHRSTCPSLVSPSELVLESLLEESIEECRPAGRRDPKLCVLPDGAWGWVLGQPGRDERGGGGADDVRSPRGTACSCPPGCLRLCDGTPGGNWTDQGVKSFKETTARAANAAAAFEKAGGKLTVYWTLGSCDIVAIAEAPNDETATAILGASGFARRWRMSE
jgi:hypothetical protein